MKIKITYDLDGKQHETEQEYPMENIKATVTRRIKTALPDARNVQVAELLPTKATK